MKDNVLFCGFLETQNRLLDGRCDSILNCPELFLSPTSASTCILPIQFCIHLHRNRHTRDREYLRSYAASDSLICAPITLTQSLNPKSGPRSFAFILCSASLRLSYIPDPFIRVWCLVICNRHDTYNYPSLFGCFSFSFSSTFDLLLKINRFHSVFHSKLLL